MKPLSMHFGFRSSRVKGPCYLLTVVEHSTTRPPGSITLQSQKWILKTTIGLITGQIDAGPCIIFRSHVWLCKTPALEGRIVDFSLLLAALLLVLPNYTIPDSLLIGTVCGGTLCRLLLGAAPDKNQQGVPPRTVQ